MQRKVVKHGQSTLTVSLPTKWVKKHHINAGDVINIQEENSQLTISTGVVSTQREVSIEFDKESTRYIRSHLGRLYRQGFDLINVSFPDRNIFSTIKEATSYLLGAQIMDVTNESCTITIFHIENVNQNIEETLRKMLLTLKCMFELVFEDITKKQFTNLQHLDEFRHNNWKLKDFLLRKATLECVSHEDLLNLANISFCYEKVGSKLVGFYKRYLMKEQKIEYSNKYNPTFSQVIETIGWLLSHLSLNKKISVEQETKFRNTLLKFNVSLFEEMKQGKNSVNPLFGFLYLSVELLDGSVSYLSSFKNSSLQHKPSDQKQL